MPALLTSTWMPRVRRRPARPRPRRTAELTSQPIPTDFCGRQRQLRGRLRGARLAEVEDGDRRALLGEPRRGPEADAACGSGDDNDPSVATTHGCGSSWLRRARGSDPSEPQPRATPEPARHRVTGTQGQASPHGRRAAYAAASPSAYLVWARRTRAARRPWCGATTQVEVQDGLAHDVVHGDEAALGAQLVDHRRGEPLPGAEEGSRARAAAPAGWGRGRAAPAAWPLKRGRRSRKASRSGSSSTTSAGTSPATMAQNTQSGSLLTVPNLGSRTATPLSHSTGRSRPRGPGGPGAAVTWSKCWASPGRRSSGPVPRHQPHDRVRARPPGDPWVRVPCRGRSASPRRAGSPGVGPAPAPSCAETARTTVTSRRLSGRGVARPPSRRSRHRRSRPSAEAGRRGTSPGSAARSNRSASAAPIARAGVDVRDDLAAAHAAVVVPVVDPHQPQ